MKHGCDIGRRKHIALTMRAASGCTTVSTESGRPGELRTFAVIASSIQHLPGCVKGATAGRKKRKQAREEARL